MDISGRGRRALRVRVGRLVDGTAAEVVEDAALLVLDGRIAQVGPDAAVARPEDARSIALPGGTAIPGLIDGHVHVTFSPSADPVRDLETETDEDLVVRGVAACERMVRVGVTTAYDCGARGMTAYRIRDAVARGLGLGPRLMVSGRAITKPGGHCHFLGGEASDVDDVRAAVRRMLDEEGADGIKIMATGGGMTPGTDSRFASYSVEELAAAADEAHRFGKRITSHAHGVPGIRNASEAGIDSIQHCTMLGPDWTWTFDEDVARAMVERGTRAVPTIGAGTRAEIEAGIMISKLQPNPGRVTRADWQENARRLLDIGVTVVPGTDVGINLTDFGEELLFELEAYVGIGVAPADVILMATASAARHLDIADRTGTLEPGKDADVLVVEGEPDRDIFALRHPLLVLRAGQPIQPTPPPPLPVRQAPAAPA
jgi:imidazolonepropionase-like amidohydrolase